MGQLTLKLPETLQDALKSRASQEGVSLDQYIVFALTRQVATSYTVQVIPEESVLQQKEDYERLLASLGEPSLSKTKAYLEEREVGIPEEGLTDEMIARLEEKFRY